jgi:hypothetical protein
MPQTDNTQVPAYVINTHTSQVVGGGRLIFIHANSTPDSDQHLVLQTTEAVGTGFNESVFTEHVFQNTSYGLDGGDRYFQARTVVAGGPTNNVTVFNVDNVVTVDHTNSMIPV